MKNKWWLAVGYLTVIALMLHFGNEWLEWSVNRSKITFELFGLMISQYMFHFLFGMLIAAPHWWRERSKPGTWTFHQPLFWVTCVPILLFALQYPLMTAGYGITPLVPYLQSFHLMWLPSVVGGALLVMSFRKA
ncbi:hypothetical protein [Staphylospora marina]|uniref:hypothetical protein n=1 Tax=Staphylospora marina TaxID=2490858 RepID=UPI000F5B987F|nr:hypothetical protein [Staphylospora marina]